MRKNEREIIKNLVEASRSIHEMKNGFEKNKSALVKIAGSTRLERPVAGTSRPSSGMGTTFHFRHTVKSKRNDISADPASHTTAAVHQAYIERKEAVEKLSDAESQIIKEADDTIIQDNGKSSFGRIGKTKSEREDFWRKIEASEGRTARVQSRIIAELPHESTPGSRARMVQDFCKSLDEYDLPWWASIHKPTKKNDSRNYHVHITYFDRPSKIDQDGVWDFEKKETIKDEKGRKRTRRPWRQNKPEAVRSIGWVKDLRKKFSEAVNGILKNEKIEKRYDPRSYKESGINKVPTVHLGPKASALEGAGLPTSGGKINAKREADWEIKKAKAPWMEEIGWAERFLEWGGKNNEALKKALNVHIDIAKDGIEIAQKRAETDLFLRGSVSRIIKRSEFLSKTRERIFSRSGIRSIDVTADTIGILFNESVVINGALSEIQPARREIQKKLEDLFADEKNMKETIGLSKKTIDRVLELSSNTERNDKTNDSEKFLSTENTKKEEIKIPEPATNEEIIRKAMQSYGKMEESLERMKIYSLEAPTLDTAENTRNARRKMEKDLEEESNGRLRALWSVTVDSAIMANDKKQQIARLLAVGMCEREAERRGLSLETGRHDVSMAKEKSAGERHMNDDIAIGERRALARRIILKEQSL